MTANEMIRVSVLLFGQARELAGRSETSLEIASGATVGDAVARLEEVYPALAPLDRVLLTAVNETYATRDEAIGDGDTLAVFPPVSGGEEKAPGAHDYFEITRAPIDIVALRDRLLRGEDGAVCIFDGVGRNNTRGRATRYLEYDGYEAMAIKTMEQIAAEIHEKWPGIDAVGIVHRLGRVEVGESSVVIVVTSPHRKVAFEGCQFAIDRLKQIVPIWKKEYFEDGAVWVQGEAWPE
jgi:molybdopterin synthase catalytic subunit